MEQRSEIERAKALLRSVLMFDQFKCWQPVGVMMSVAKQQGIRKSAMRTARKELGVISLTGEDGQQYWAFPDRVGLSDSASDKGEQ